MSRLAVLLLGLFLARSALVVCLGDVFFYGEELAKSAAARALVSNTDLPWARLAYLPYEGGGFVIAHVDALVFAVLGPSLLALKVVALLWTSAILVVGYRFCRARFGETSALVFGALFVLAPVQFQQLSLLALGIHHEALLFVLLVLHFGGRIAFDGDERPRTWLGLGAAAGFGLYFSYTLVPVVLAVTICLGLRRERRLLGRGGALALLGLLLGASPWILGALELGESVLDIHGHEAASSGGWRAAPAALAELSSSAAEHAPALVVLAGLGLLALFATRSPDPERRPEGARFLLLVALAAYGAALIGGGFDEPVASHAFSFKRLCQPWLYLTLLASSCLGAWIESRHVVVRSIGQFLLALLLLSGFFGLLGVARAGAPATPRANLALLASTKGYAWAAYVRSLDGRLDSEPAERVRVLSRLLEPDAAYLYPAVADQVWRMSKQPREDVFAALRSADSQRWLEYLPGLGTWWRVLQGPDIRSRTDEALRLPPQHAEGLVEATGRDALGPRVTIERLEREVRRGLDKGLPEAYFEGLGYGIPYSLGSSPSGSARPWLFFPALPEAFLAAQEPRVADAMRRGWHRALVDRSL